MGDRTGGRTSESQPISRLAGVSLVILLLVTVLILNSWVTDPAYRVYPLTWAVYALVIVTELIRIGFVMLKRLALLDEATSEQVFIMVLIASSFSALALFGNFCWEISRLNDVGEDNWIASDEEKKLGSIETRQNRMTIVQLIILMAMVAWAITWTFKYSRTAEKTTRAV